jgi:hypothetical protein
MYVGVWCCGGAGADVLVATPGRLGDLLERYDVFDLRELEVRHESTAVSPTTHVVLHFARDSHFQLLV